MALVTRFWRVTIDLMTARLFALVIMYIIASFWRATIAPIITWLLCRLTRAITQVILAYRYCAFGDADFTAYYCAFSDTNLSCSYYRYNGAWFCALDMRYVVASFGIPLYRQFLRGLYGSLYRVLWLAFCVRHMRFKPGAFMSRYSRYNAVALAGRYIAFGRGIFREIISIILVFTCNQVQFI